jgi:hypothetical protein
LAWQQEAGEEKAFFAKRNELRNELAAIFISCFSKQTRIGQARQIPSFQDQCRGLDLEVEAMGAASA